MPTFEWIKYMEILATELNKKYQEEKKNFPSKLQQIVNEGRVTCMGSKTKPWSGEEFDPDTFFASIAKLHNKNRTKLIRFYFDKFSLEDSKLSDLPLTFEGFPSFYAREQNFTESYSKENQETLWEFLDCALEYADSNVKTEQLTSKFVQLYDSVHLINGYQTGARITNVLFFIRPNFYMNLNEPSSQYLKKISDISGVINVDLKHITGEKYLELLASIKRSISSGVLKNINISSIPELSWVAYQEQQKTNQEQPKTMESKKNYWWIGAEVADDQLVKKKIGPFQLKTVSDNKNFETANKNDQVIIYNKSSKFIVAVGSVGLKYKKKGKIGIQTTRIFSESGILSRKDIEDSGLFMESKFLDTKGVLFNLTVEEYNNLNYLIKTAMLTQKKEEIVRSNQEELEKCFVDEYLLKKIKALLEHKKNIILQGPPGVGKTYIAKRIAFAQMGDINQDQIQMVQFHPNYSYEDFICGYKPTNSTNSGFELQDGIFKEFCDRANKAFKESANPELAPKYFFIIDEINRGNLGKIFGEAMMLIETSHRGEYLKLSEQKFAEEKDQELFTIPPNVYLIGTMNTADRSLALLDYALRRRFCFIDLPPAFELPDNWEENKEKEKNTAREKFNSYVKNIDKSGFFESVINKIIELNKKIAEDPSLGKGFLIGHSYFCNLDPTPESLKDRLKEIIEYEIVPMLREYWFDNGDIFKKQARELRTLFSNKPGEQSANTEL